jgi:hypothetical protein
MSTSRRQFLTETLALMGTAAATKLHAKVQDPTKLPPGAPSAFGAGPGVGPEVTTATFAEAEKLVQVELTPVHGNWPWSQRWLHGRTSMGC